MSKLGDRIRRLSSGYQGMDDQQAIAREVDELERKKLIRSDERVELIYSRKSDEFAASVNSYLAEGGWRIVSSHALPMDNDYFAMLIKNKE